MGSGINSIRLERLLDAIGGVLQATALGGFQIAAKPIPLAEVEQAWPEDDSAKRTVFTVDLQQA